MLSQSSIEILRNLEDFSIDVGLTYLDNEPIEGHARPRRSTWSATACWCAPTIRWRGASSVSWADAAKEPLCLLTPDMQNRRIIDRAFRAANCAPVPRLETNSVINLCANVHLMGLASIIPEYFLEVIGPISDVRAVPLTDPLVEHSVGLVAVDRDPVSPLVLAAFECAQDHRAAGDLAAGTDAGHRRGPSRLSAQSIGPPSQSGRSWSACFHVWLIVLLLLFAQPVFAQSIISGTVTDPQSAVVPGARVGLLGRTDRSPHDAHGCARALSIRRCASRAPMWWS